MKKLYILLLAACTFASCKPNLNTGTPKAGTGDFSRYLAVGNSLTAGYADNSLYRTGQMNSYPQRLSEQFALVGGGPFKQPLMPGDFGYPNAKLVLANIVGCDGLVSLTPVPYTGPADTAGSATNISLTGPYNNFGIPGIRSVDYLVNGYAAIVSVEAPYAARIFNNPVANRPLDELNYTVANLHPTFFSLWLGSNDVLAYAVAGGTGNAIGTVLPNGFVLPTDISPDSLFKHCYDSVLNVLTSGGAKGVLINLPDVSTIPFFNTVPANGLTLRAGQADSLNAYYWSLGASKEDINFVPGQNYFLVTVHDGGVRQAKAGELILLTAADSIACAGWGTLKPIPNDQVLTTDEIQNIKDATDAFNSIIQTEGYNRKLPIVDMHNYLRTITSGISFNGVHYNAQFVTGGAFSLDGVHLTPRGYAIVANQIILTINSYYSSSIPLIDVNKYGGVKFP